jgi:hypothetical protein
VRPPEPRATSARPQVAHRTLDLPATPGAERALC